MANPQVENGFTRIANELLEAICKIRIPGEERLIIDAVFRKTYGWHKCEDRISLGQLSQATGMTRANCARALKRCVLSGMITRVIKGDSTSCNVLKINKNYDEWVLSALIPAIKHDNRGAIKTHNRGAINPDTHKRKNIQKKLYKIYWDAEKKDFSGITKEDVTGWEEAFPAIDIQSELLKAREWVRASPKNIKSNWNKFFVGWFSRAQDRPKR